MAEDDDVKVMSQAVAIIYRELFDELKSAKQQQWRITNYLLAVLGGIFGIAKSLGHLTDCEKAIATAIAATALIFVLILLFKIQWRMGKTRRRLDRVESRESKYFSPQEREILELKPFECPALRDLLFLFVLLGVSVIGSALVIYALWRSVTSI